MGSADESDGHRKPAFQSRLIISAVAFVTAAAAVLVPSPLALTASHNPSKLHQRTLYLQRGDATAVQLEIHALNGRFTLGPGTRRLLDAEVQYADGETAPMVTYVERASRGFGNLYQPLAKPNVWLSSSNIWQVRLREAFPYGILLNLGGGEANVDLSHLEIFRLHVRSQSDQLRLNLSEMQPRAMLAFITYTGMGSAQVKLPTHVPVLVSALNTVTSVNGEPIAVNATWSNHAYGRMTGMHHLITLMIAEESGPVELLIDEP